MKVKYDKEADVLYIQLSDSKIAESDEERQGVIIDYANNGKVVGIEILDATSSIHGKKEKENERKRLAHIVQQISATKVSVYKKAVQGRKIARSKPIKKGGKATQVLKGR